MPRSGEELFGRYRTLRRIGRGRFGEVWEAKDQTGERVALKLPLEGSDTWPAERMEREFDALRQVEHPNVVGAVELLPSAGGLVLELIDGQDLLGWVRGDLKDAADDGPRKNLPMVFGQVLQDEGTSAYRRCSEEGLRRLLAAVRDFASAIHCIHQAGWIHLDLTADNLRVTNDARPVVLDMGLAIPISSSATGHDYSGELVGSAPYLAPELGSTPPSPASDWYSFGVVVFEALTGQLPFDGGGPDVFIRKRSIAAPRASELVANVPAYLDELCAGWLARSPLRRAGIEALGALPKISP